MSTYRSATGAAVVAALLAAGCASTGGTAAGGPATAEMVASGESAYSSSCAGCHGQAGEGTPRAPNLADDEWIWIQPEEGVRPQIVRIVRTGVPDPRVHMNGMPPVGANMPEDQVQAIAAYVESL